MSPLQPRGKPYFCSSVGTGSVGLFTTSTFVGFDGVSGAVVVVIVDSVVLVDGAVRVFTKTPNMNERTLLPVARNAAKIFSFTSLTLEMTSHSNVNTNESAITIAAPITPKIKF